MVGDIDDVDVIFAENVYDADETIVISESTVMQPV